VTGWLCSENTTGPLAAGAIESPTPVGPVAPTGPVGPVAIVDPVGLVDGDGVDVTVGVPETSGPPVPVLASGPVAPLGPLGPLGPVGPLAPLGPVGPVSPMGPVAPVGPLMPLAARDPLGPVGPVTPVAGLWACASPAAAPPMPATAMPPRSRRESMARRTLRPTRITRAVSPVAQRSSSRNIPCDSFATRSVFPRLDGHHAQSTGVDSTVGAPGKGARRPKFSARPYICPAVLDLLTELMAVVPAGCSYAEARWVAERSQLVRVRDGGIDRIEDDESAGIGVRVRWGGAWGFAATRDVSSAGARSALARALAVAQAQPRTPRTPLAALEQPARGHWDGPCLTDPFSVSLEDKLALLQSAEQLLRSDRRIVLATAECQATRTETAFASSDGAAFTQLRTACGGGIGAVAVDDVELQVRSYPGAHGGSVAGAGWEHVLALDLPGQAARVGQEAVALLTASACPAGVSTVILHGEQVALQVHESIGHALELDRILLGEASYAGTSWVSADDVGQLRYGSPQLNVTADATIVGGLGSFGWDDEGVAACRTPLITEGVLRATLSDRTSAAAAGLAQSGGCARADGFARQPIVRMTNVSLEAGEAGTLEELVSDTDDGLYLETNRSWSIDDRRLNFQFATELAREIRGGELRRLYRNATYAGITPRFWASLDAVCSPADWRIWGLLNCGKGEPGQTANVSHGAAPARFRGVQVGSAQA
jgi:TldD protein